MCGVVVVGLDLGLGLGLVNKVIVSMSRSSSLAYVLQLDLEGVKEQEAVLGRLVHVLEVPGSQVGEVWGRD